MTNEQREAIDSLGKLVKLRKDKTNTIKHDTCICGTMDLDTVLSLIKEQQEEIGSLQKELNEENKRSMILANNDKFKEQVIELMSELVYERFKPELLLEYGFESKEQFKQYFAELVRKE